MTSLPTALILGDTATIQHRHPDYLASDGWTCKVSLIGNSTLTVSAVADNDGGFTATIPAARTELLGAGTYTLAVRMYRGDAVHTVASAVTDVRSSVNPLIAEIQKAERVLTLLDARIEGRFITEEDAVESFGMSNRQFNRVKSTDLLTMRAEYARKLTVLKNYQRGVGGIKGITIRVGRVL
jgi:hypothetical protein